MQHIGIFVPIFVASAYNKDINWRENGKLKDLMRNRWSIEQIKRYLI